MPHSVSGFKYTFVLYFILIFTFFIISQALGETRYVSDYLTINIKDNLEKPYKVVAKVKSNDPVIVLEETDTYAKVETPDKQVGWIAKQYLTASLPKNLIIEQLRNEIAALKSNPSSLESAPKNNDPTGNSMTAERDRLQSELQVAMTKIAELQDSLATKTGQPIEQDTNAINETLKQLDDKKKQLEAEIGALQVQYESLSDGTVDVSALIKEKEDLLTQLQDKNEKISSLTAENEKLAEKAMIYWFCAGALVFIIGLFSGKVFSRKKTKYSY